MQLTNIKIYLVFSFLLVLTSFSNTIRKNSELAGKSFKALVGQTCREMIDGGCMIYTYERLTFHEDSVRISYEVQAYCSPEEREKNYTNLYSDRTMTFNWHLKNDTVELLGNTNFKELIFQDSLLYGFDNSTNRHVVFHEITN